jgi:GTPase SAR1 family protein
LDGSGKSEIVFRMLSNGALGQYIAIPTPGVAYSEFSLGKSTVGIFDCGGMARYRDQWASFVQQSDGVVWVIDRTDSERLVRVHEEITDIIGLCASLELPLLVLVNKSDLKSNQEIPDRFIVNHALEAHVDYTVKECQATSGEGILAARDWLVNRIESNARAKSVTVNP